MDRRLIVTADDYNLCPSVDRGIEEAVERGIVTSVSVIVTRPFLTREKGFLRHRSKVSIGLHVTLDVGRARSMALRRSKYVDPEGSFRKSSKDELARWPALHMKAEMEAQIEAFVHAVGRMPTHLDTHHQAQRRWPIFEALCTVAARLGIPVRSTSDRMRRTLRRAGVPTPDHFVGGTGTAPYWTRGTLIELLGALRPGTTELMCHPGHFGPDLAGSRYGPQRETELVALLDPGVRTAFKEAGVRLMGYSDLGGGKESPGSIAGGASGPALDRV